MSRFFRRFRDHFSRQISSFKASLAPADPAFALQRICPFCGLITPRSKTSCLECGKSLAPTAPAG
ncbi:MAG: hypothetical protein WCF48_12410 [Terriglobales bacterium]